MIDTAALAEWFEELSNGQLARAFWAAVIASVVVPYLPFGRQILYPFALLSTWAHEMGHGVTAIAAGGRFDRLEVHRNLGGLAYSSGVGPLGRAWVAAGGLLAPTIAGGLIIILGAREVTAPWVLAGLAVAVVVSVALFVRNRFGWIALGLCGIALVGVAYQAPEIVRIFLAQLIGIQFCVAAWGSVNYMFTRGFHRDDGAYTNSDTQTIADALMLPYWFWGSLISLISVMILGGSFYLAWIVPA